MSTKKKPWTRDQKIVTVITIILTGVSISVILLNEPIVINLELNKIKDADFENNYFKLDYLLINNYRDSIIFPDDKLTIKAALINKWDNDMNYFPTIKVLQGEKIIEGPFQLQNYTLIPNGGWTFFQQEFFVGDESTKRLQITIVGFDKAENQIITEDIEVELSILSLSNKIQSDQANTLLIGVIASFTIGGGTLSALYFSNRTSHKEIKKLDKQNELLEDQIKLLKTQNEDLKEQQSIQNRPWISLEYDKPMVIRDNLFELSFRNHGKSVAHNVTGIGLLKKGEITEKEIIENGEIYPEFDASPNETFSQFILIPEHLRSAVNETDEVYLGLVLNYTFEETKIGKSVLIAHWRSSTRQLLYKIKKID